MDSEASESSGLQNDVKKESLPGAVVLVTSLVEL